MGNSASARPGSVYIIVLGSAMAVSVIGLSALMTVRITRRSAQETAGLAQARMHARTAIEMGLHQIASISDWRSTFPNGTWLQDQPIGTGTYSLEGVDPNDADLADSEADPLVLTGIGVEGDARYKLEVTLTGEIPPLTSLEVSWHAGNDMLFNAGSELHSDQIVSANDAATTSGSAAVYADVEAVNSITGSGFHQNTTTGIEPRTMPDPVTVFDHYKPPVGTAINVGALPTQAGKVLLTDVVLSPTSNPYGPVNAQGIYVIDCLSQSISIEYCRIVATLVLLNVGSDSIVTGLINWEPAIANYPALLAQGTMAMEHWNTDSLSETSRGVNFNPIGTPYGGEEDTTQDDFYPSVIKGLVYVSNDITTWDVQSYQGVFISGNSTVYKGNSNVIYQSIYLNDPPPGFTGEPQMIIADGSWRRMVD